MKSTLCTLAAGIVLAGVSGAQAQPSYTVVDLGGLAGGFTEGFNINNNHIATGQASIADGTQHALVWGGPFRIDIGQTGLNSTAFAVNLHGQVALQAETAAKDPNNENFCAYGTGRACLPSLWQRGVLTALPLPGGNNGTIGNVNNLGQVSGIAETAVRDKQCPTATTISGTGPQLFDFQAVIWNPGAAQATVLAPLPGDTVGMTLWINDNGQAVGGSGTCDSAVLPPIASASHIVLWDKSGAPHDLGNLGSAAANMAIAINNQGQVTGSSSLTPDGAIQHAFLWTSQSGMKDLGTLPGDVLSVGVAINDQGQLTGESDDAEGNARAILWQNGVMYDLNAAAHNSPLYLLCALSINGNGEIVGFGATAKGDVHAYLATPAGNSSAAAASSAGLFDRIPIESRAAAYAQLDAMFRNGAIPGVRYFHPRRPAGQR